MRRFILEFQNGDLLENAGTKAPMDISSILANNGYRAIYIKTCGGNTFKQIWLMALSLTRLVFSAKRGSLLVFQYPIYSQKGAIAFQFARIILRLKKVKVVCLIHDLIAARTGTGIHTEVTELNKNDFIIVHSPQMAALLKDSGCTASSIVLGMFDYLVNTGNHMQRRLTYDIVFAGNLSKSLFLSQLGPITSNSPVQFILYGRNGQTMNFGSGIEYGGSFSPDNVSSLKGSWGLVWDGDSIDDLTGEAGDYQKINSPHKASLYLVAGLPIIVSAKAAIASIVENERIGITVNSLHEMAGRISRMTDDDYQAMLNNVHGYGSKLAFGRSILSALDQI